MRISDWSSDVCSSDLAEFRNPVMMYSVGKDSSVLLHLLVKAFHPARPPIPLLHVDTTWKFREMIAFRDRRALERSEEHTSELQSLMRISYAVFCLKKKKYK